MWFEWGRSRQKYMRCDKASRGGVGGRVWDSKMIWASGVWEAQPNTGGSWYWAAACPTTHMNNESQQPTPLHHEPLVILVFLLVRIYMITCLFLPLLSTHGEMGGIRALPGAGSQLPPTRGRSALNPAKMISSTYPCLWPFWCKTAR